MGYNTRVRTESRLITDYQYELGEDHHHPGSGRYGVRVRLPADISPSFPFLNTVLDDTIYDHENSILIGASEGRRYAFRPHEIQLGMVADPSKAPDIVEKAIELVNRVWAGREHIEPSYRERQLPPVYEIYKCFPRTNCKQCGYPSCLAFAADIRSGAVTPESCPLLSQPEYEENRKLVIALLYPEQSAD
jgi:ArsR family metal-binding transcriptional regulator